ncbi:MAG: C4-dicarboxylate ABC transporter permease [Azoarcus sp.]|nr:MAG: C4-dicarboxylate ABC transporter permease [Azoarcus sp.]TVT57941.1 MAG: TRAP transporter large permease [Azoarcus sp. PHD]
MLIVAVAFFGLMLLGMPIGVVIGISGAIGLVQLGDVSFLAMAPKRYFEGLDMFTFMAMPFFILAGELMNASGITQRLIAFALSLVGYLRGGLAHANMVASVLFAGMTGAAVSDAAAMGNTLVPAMVKQGYSKPFACAVTAAGSIIGPTIPPSNLMVIYGSIMGVSIAGLFAAGIVPGLLICAICMGVIAALGKKLGLPKGEDRPSLMSILISFKDSLIGLTMPAIILGGILFGIVTPTEAASIAVGYAMFVGFAIYRTLTLRQVGIMLIRTARITGSVFLIIAAASILSWWLTFHQIPQMIAQAMLSVASSKEGVLALILVLLLFVGMFLDITAALIILAPVLGPLTAAVGIDPVHAGIMIILALNISLMTPPVGACLFVLCSVTGEKMERIARALTPFLIAEVAILFLITYWSDLTLFVPRLFGYVQP